ncbi:type II and III secretion system protein family protein [Rhizobium sp. C1]|uniref:type II and III secretion system protein family protein n=1 Tax=Rhizobium sp. C1 TaxID=1349799 RepID=UPI001E3D29E3|nr:type II and III secretion system protein family protein [Rhizobium sp. C1]MCD2178961.1 type II and III secretion system protein family protein [Rhizobium sp. C1]
MKDIRKTTIGGLCFTLALTGIVPVPLAGAQGIAAFAASESLVTISQAGPGVKKHLKLGLNKALVVELPADAHDILVADPSLADAVTRTSRRLYLFGKAVGQTNVFVFGADGKEVVSLDIQVERDISQLETNLRRFLPDSDIKVEIISDNIVLTGTVRTPQDAAQASKLAEIFVKGGEATTRNETASGSGTSSSVAIFAEDRQQSQIVNLLTIQGEDQVTLKVTVAEVSRQVIKQLGINSSVSGSNGAFSFINPTNLGGTANGLSSALGTAVAGAAGSLGGGIGLAAYLNAMEQAGVMRTLAEPSLTAISGEVAKFYVGGSFNMVTTQTSTPDSQSIAPNGAVINTPGTITRGTQTSQYGISLSFLPVVMSAGRISLKLETEVSEPTYEGSVASFGDAKHSGVTQLGIRRRQASTTVELPSGGSIMIAGLVSDDVRQAFSGNPALAKIPILGTMFRSKDFQRNETELVIIATPYLVRAVSADKLARPDDNFIPENDAATFFLNSVNKAYGTKMNPASGQRYQGNVGFIYK